MTETSYTPGTWFGIVGAHATVVLPPSAKGRAAALWSLIDDGAGFDEVLDALVAEGLRGLPAFVLVAGDERSTRVVVRGAATVTAHTATGPVAIDGGDGLTWVERTLGDVAGYAVSIDGEEATGNPMVVAAGLVRVSGVQVPPETASTPVPVPAEAASEPAPAPILAAVPDPLSGPIDLDEEPEPEPAEEEPLFDDDVPTDVDLPAYQPPAPAFPPPAFPPPVTAPVDLEPPNAPNAPVAPGAAEPEAEEPEPEPAGGVRLEFSSGQQVEVDRVVVVGRAPDPGRFSHVDQPLMVTVPSPHQEISSTHLEVRPGSGAEQGTALVTDLGSTNGTVLVRPGERPEELRPGVPVPLVAGAVIDLGDGLTITVAQG